MDKNLIYMVAIDHHTSQFKVTEYSKYSIPAWRAWCKKNNIDFMVVTEHDERFDKPIWNKELVFENKPYIKQVTDSIESAISGTKNI